MKAKVALYAWKQAVKEDLYVKNKEAEGLVALVEAQGVNVNTLLRATTQVFLPHPPLLLHYRQLRLKN